MRDIQRVLIIHMRVQFHSLWVLSKLILLCFNELCYIISSSSNIHTYTHTQIMLRKICMNFNDRNLYENFLKLLIIKNFYKYQHFNLVAGEIDAMRKWCAFKSWILKYILKAELLSPKQKSIYFDCNLWVEKVILWSFRIF